MRWPRFRFRIGGLLVMVALSAVSFWAWREYHRPVRVWSRKIRDSGDPRGAHFAINLAFSGKIPGLSKERAIAELNDCMSNPEYGIRATAAATLIKLGMRDRLPEYVLLRLIAMLEDPNGGNSEFAASAISQVMGPDSPHRDRAKSALFALMNRPDESTRFDAMAGLNVMMKPGDPGQPAFVAALKADRTLYGPGEKYLPAACLIDQGEVEAASPRIVELIKDPSAIASWSSLDLIWSRRLVIPGTEPELERIALDVQGASNDPNREINRAAAAAILIRLGRPEIGRPVLLEIRRSGSESARQVVEMFLKELEEGQEPARNASISEAASLPLPPSPPSAPPPAARGAARGSTSPP